MILIDMEMPTVCVDGDWYGNCPLDRLWCAQRFAPKGYTLGKMIADQQDKLPKWCPLPEFEYEPVEVRWWQPLPAAPWERGEEDAV